MAHAQAHAIQQTHPFPQSNHSMQDLKQPDLKLGKAGRPSKAATEEGTARMKSYLEDLRVGIDAAKDAIKPASSRHKGRGGIGTAKTCGACKQRGFTGKGVPPPRKYTSRHCRLQVSALAQPHTYLDRCRAQAQQPELSVLR